MNQVIVHVPASFWDAAVRGDHVPDDPEASYPPVSEDVYCEVDNGRVAGEGFVFEPGDGADTLRAMVNLLARGEDSEIVLKRGMD